MTTKAKMFSGAIGLVVSATNENEQEDLFFPCDPRLVAVNVNGDPELGSTVWDLNSKNELDEKRGAYLQSAFRVIKEPLGVANAIAFQLGPAGMADTGGGWYVDIPDGGNASLPEIAIGQGSYGARGPFHVGHKNDRHKRGVDADGNPINPMHLWAKSLFYLNREEDGPLHITDWKRGQESGFEHIVHFGWNGEIKEWDWYVKIPITLTPVPTPTPVPTDPTGPSPAVVNKPLGPTIGPSVPTPGHAQPNTPTSKTATIGLSHVAILNEMSTPGTLSKPTPTRSGKQRLNNLLIFTEALREGAANQANQTPICGQTAAFGAEGGERTGGYAGQGRSASGDPWAYNQRPGVGKYPEGTAGGGWIILPPEVSINDIATGFAPAGITQSTVYFLVGPNAYFGAGLPEISDGSIQDGFSWGWESSTGDLLYRRHQDGATPSEVARFVNSTGDFRVSNALEIDGALNHDGSTIGLFGATPVSRPTYGAPTGTATRTTFDTTTVTLSGLAERVKAMIDDFQSRGDYA